MESTRKHHDLPNSDTEPLTCPNCGGDVPVDAARCPYCNAINPRGAQAAYMEELESLRQDTDRLDDDVQHNFARELAGNARRTIAIVVALVVLIVGALGAARCAANNDEQQELRDFQARETFREQHFDEFDRLYREDDPEALVAFAWSLEDEPGFEALYSWKHMPYLETCEDWVALKMAQSAIEQGSRDVDDYVWATTAALQLACLDQDGQRTRTSITPEDEQRVSSWRVQAHQFLADTLAMSPDELDAFAISVKDDQGYIQLDVLRKALEQRLREIGTI